MTHLSVHPLAESLVILPLKNCRNSWDGIEGTARVFFIAAFSLLDCLRLLHGSQLAAFEAKPKVGELYELLEGGAERGINDFPILAKSFHLNSAQQRIASALDRWLNWSLTNFKKFYDEPQWGRPNNALLFQPPGLRLWFLASPQDKEVESLLYRAAQAFWMFKDFDEADAWIESLANDFCTDASSQEAISKLYKQIKLQNPSYDPDYVCLAFVIARVNAHKHHPIGTSRNTRPLLLECVVTAIAFKALSELIRWFQR
ncbi:MAG: hypothetical protein JSR74_11140 [Proteobacteria bacterium]|nr:hypothetical protein [Pseudomonadota bacterium]